MYKVFETIFILIFCLHALVCCFIAIGHMEPTDNTNESWIFRMALYKDGRASTDFKFNTPEDQTTESNFNIYWTAWYYVTTSITTVGYGDISGATAPEMLFIIFLLFTGILIFTIIQQRTRSLLKEPTMKMMSDKAYADAIDFLFLIDDPLPTAIDNKFYEYLAEYKQRECEKSTW